MSNVLRFKTKQDRNIEQRLKELSAMFALIRKENQKIKKKLILMDRNGFIKIMEGDGNFLPFLQVPDKQPFEFTSFL